MAGEIAIELWVISLLGIGFIYFIINKYIGEKDNPYGFSQYFDRSLVKVKMYEIIPASYNEKVVRPIPQFRGIGLYGQQGLWFKGLFPVHKDFFMRAEPGFYHFYYKSGGMKTIIPLIMTMFYSDSIAKEDLPVAVEKSTKAEAAEVIESHKDKHPYVMPEHSHLAFLIPAKEQLEMMTDNFIDSFMTRQQSIAIMTMSQLDILGKVIIPVALILIMSIVLMATAMTFAGGIVEKGIDATLKGCPDSTPQSPSPSTPVAEPIANTTKTHEIPFVGTVGG